MLSLIFGGTVWAISTVLSAFMAGLAIGSWWFGKEIDGRWQVADGKKIFAYLMAGIGIYCAFTPILFNGIEKLYISLFTLNISQYFLHITRFILGFLVILIPTALMGGTLPVLAKHFSISHFTFNISQNVGILYSVNTWGAVFGAFATGYILIMFLGVKGTLYLAAAINLLIAGVMFLSSRNVGVNRHVHPKDDTAVVHYSPINRATTTKPSLLATRYSLLILIAIALSGFTALSYEIVWTRVLSMILGSSVYAITIILCTFLAGIALGSMIYAKFSKNAGINCPNSGDTTSSLPCNSIERATILFGFLEAGIGVSVLLLIPVFGVLPLLFLGIFKTVGSYYSMFTFSQFLLSFSVMLIPTVLFGATLPLACKVYSVGAYGSVRPKRDDTAVVPYNVGTSVGNIYAANTIGAILGSLLTGFLFINLFGLQRTIFYISMVNMLIGLFFLSCNITPRRLKSACPSHIACYGRRAATIVISYLLLFFFLPPWNKFILNSGVFAYAKIYAEESNRFTEWKKMMQEGKILYYKEGLHSTVMVRQDPETDIISLSIDGKVDASNNIDGDMYTELLVGHLPLMLHSNPERVLLIGLASGITLGAVQKHKVKEIICVEIEPAMKQACKFFNKWNQNCLQDTRTKLIINDARNYLLSVKEKYDIIISEPSNPWISSCSKLFTREYFEICKKRLTKNGIFCQWFQHYKMSLRDFKIGIKTFQSVFPHTSLWLSGGGDTILIGTGQALKIKYEVLKERFKNSNIKSDLKKMVLDKPASFLTNFLMGEKRVIKYTGDVLPLNTDNRPIIEFSAPRSLYNSDAQQKNYLSMVNARESVSPFLSYKKEDSIKLHFRLANAYIKREFYNQALQELLEIIKKRPAHKVARNMLGYVYLCIEDYDKARAEFQYLVTTYPNFAPAFINMGQYYLALGDYEQAIKMLKKAIKICPQNALPYNNLGNIYRKQKDYDRAIKEFKNAIKLNPELYIAYDNLGLVYLRKGLINQAIKEFKKAISIFPDFAPSYFHLGTVYDRLNMTSEAERMFNRAITLNPKYRRAFIKQKAKQS